MYQDWRLQYESYAVQRAALIHQGLVGKACSRITAVVPHIHRVIMSLKKASLNLLRSRLPKFRQLGADSRRPGYRYMAYFYLQGIKFKMYYWPKAKKAGAMIEVTSPSPASLEDLWKRLKALDLPPENWSSLNVRCMDH